MTYFDFVGNKIKKYDILWVKVDEEFSALDIEMQFFV